MIIKKLNLNNPKEGWNGGIEVQKKKGGGGIENK